MDEDQCCICHESLKNGKQVFELPECKHKYHTHCIGAWWCAPRDRHNPEGTCHFVVLQHLKEQQLGDGIQEKAEWHY